MLRKQLQRSLLFHVITYLSSKCVKSVGKMKKTDLFPKTRIQKFLDKSPWDSHCNIHMFLSFLGSLLKRCILFENFSQFSLPPPYTKMKLEKKFWIYASNIVCGVGGGGVGLGPVWIGKRPRNAKVSQDLLSMIVGRRRY